ncbi:hypothetical protein C1645_838671 [Glomus cerebriforme]|uniref:Uncharacterized protein n=1 Tax=Glomus cerebriforme TaxID=658196 RepID=A0A397S3A0_9GLOM|nr:hypothetical protein C1645_838671 [Glomus cerebriforme]
MSLKTESLGLKAKRKRVGDRKADKKMQWYSATYNDLYIAFMKKNMIDEAENIEEPEGYQQSEVLITVPTEILPVEGTAPSKSTSSSSKLEASPKESYPQPVSKKTPPPLPPKPDHLKASIKSSNPESIVIQSQEEIVPPADITKEKEEYGVPGAWKRDDQDPDEFDWETFAIEIEDLPNHDTNNLKDRPKDSAI